ncbi:MAG: pyridoxamine 5'-phosphate oxidase family protein [Methanomicrobiales archaeon]
MVMTEEMMEAIEKNKLIFLATSNEDNVPNVVPIGFARPLDSKTVLIVDNYMHKTHENLEKNPKASFVVLEVRECPYQFKGNIEIFESGPYFDEAVEWAHSVMTKLSPKAAIIFKVDEIYSVQPGPEAGEKVD